MSESGPQEANTPRATSGNPSPAATDAMVVLPPDAATANPWRVEFDLEWNEADAVSWWEFSTVTSPESQQRSADRRRNAFTTLVLWLICPVGVSLTYDAQLETNVLLWFFFWIFLLGILVFPPYFVSRVRRFPAVKATDVLSRFDWSRQDITHMRMDDHALHVSTSRYNVRYSWGWFENVTIAGSLVVLEGDNLARIYIPTRKFGSTKVEQAEQLDHVRELIATHGGAELRRMREFLAANSAKCPRCKYELKGLTGTNCPECLLPVAIKQDRHTLPAEA
jgi:hypothetical protein